MISIIISSYQIAFFDNISKNIAETIGCAYEIIKVENNNQMSIGEAYNKGMAMSKFEILCFCHEDVLFHEKNWGKTLLNIFKNNENVGVVGIAGNKTYGNLPVTWFDYNHSTTVLRLIQRQNDNLNSVVQGFEKQENLVEVQIIDGVFLCFEKSANLKFNTKLEGFHAYDLSISLESKKKKLTNFVTKEILLEHLSEGNINDGWYIAMNQFYKEYESFLHRPSHYPVESLEAYKSFILGLFRLNQKQDSRKHFYKFLKIKPFDKFNLLYFFKYYFK